MEIHLADVWVIGSGAAGLSAAIAARESGLSITVVTKGAPGEHSSTGLSGGGFVGAWGGLSAEEHRMRTLAAGRGLNEPALVEAMVADAPDRFQELLDWGLAVVPTSRPGSLIARGNGPARSEEIIRCLSAKAHAAGVAFLASHVAYALRMQDGAAHCAVFEPASGAWVGLGGRALVMAAGGAGGLYARHDTPARASGDAVSMALGAGALLEDMEFVQFFPLSLAEPELPPAVVPPAVADLGRLVNGHGEDVLAKYGITERPAGRRARDRLSQAMFREIEDEGVAVYADLTGVSEETWCEDPSNAASFEYLGKRCGALERPLRVAPVAHFVMGGLAIDETAATSLPGLFAAGEAAGGVHGANRMGENSLTETVVFGARAGRSAAAWATRRAMPAAREVRNVVGDLTRANGMRGPRTEAAALMTELRALMWRTGGIRRDEEGLEAGLAGIAEIRERAARARGHADAHHAVALLEVEMGARTGRLILEAAKRRRESRGAHYRADYPEIDDAWLGHLTVRQNSEHESIWSFERAS
ncbi:MAG: FAD-binding protein [Rhodospirillales bacterium]|jgi:succinate dehydrogenase/fumarate reductase flavoprotein subunit|nr:FAD-binding protein [Rhodospirillales bacterium]MDP6805862.1 FAD-binding protein [Rhodospirillales bacterium]